MDLNIRVLGSTSSGNCTLMWDSSSAMNRTVRGSALMIDCGLSPRYVCHNLGMLDLDMSSISGVLITHTHGDHVKKSMLKRLVKEKVPIFCHKNVLKGLFEKHSIMEKAVSMGLLKTFNDKEFASGAFTVKGFEVPHDSNGGCFGFNIFKKVRSGIKKVTIATDLGYPQADLIKHFVDSDVIIIESNHDRDMLENSGRPQWLKKRIKEIGHLSNDQCADFLSEIVSRSRKMPKAVILAHISQQCNTNALAGKRTMHALNESDCGETEIYMTHRRKANEIVKII